MRKNLLLIALLIMGIGLSACGKRSSDNAANEAPKEEDKPWPPQVSEGEQAVLASDLLAKNYYIVLDGSGSMADKECSGDERNKSIAAKKALQEFIMTVPQDANIGLLVFDTTGITERLALGVNNADQQALFIQQVNHAGADSSTPLASAVSMALTALEKQYRAQLGYGEYHLVIVTDGNPVPDSEDPTKVVNYILDKTPIMIHTIGFCISENHVLNQPGRTNYTTAQNPGELIAGLKQVLAEAEQFDLVKFE